MSGNEQRFQEVMNQGHSAAWDQQWDQAAAHYLRALEEFPDEPKALTNLGLAYFEMENDVEAIRWYLKACKASPEDPVPLEKVGEISERMGKHDQAAVVHMRAAELYAKNRDLTKALENWRRVTSLNPESLPAHSRLAMVYERLGKKQQAVNEYIAIASIFQSRGDMSKTVQTLTHALKVLPQSQEVARAMAIIKAGQRLPRPTRPKMPAPAKRPLQLQLEAPKQPESEEESLDPVEAAQREALSQLAGLLFEQPSEQQEQQAIRRGLGAIVRGLEGAPPQQVDQTRIMLHLSQGVDLQSRQQPGGAIVEIERALEAGLDHPAAYLDLGLLLAQNGQGERALPNLQKAVRHSSFAPGARLLLGSVLLEAGRVNEAAVEYLEALRQADTQTAPEGQADALDQLYEPLIEAHLQNQDGAFLRGLCENVKKLLARPGWREQIRQARMQLPESAAGGPPVPLAEILSETHGSQIVESIARIHQYSRMGFQRAAMEEAFFALQHAPTYLPLHIYIGDMLVQQGRVQLAVEKYSSVANSYAVRGESQRSLNMLRRITEISPMDLNSRTCLIDQLTGLGRTDEALQEYLNLAEMYYSMADLIQARQTYQEALRLAQQARADNRWKVRILHHMADIDQQSLDWRQAIKVYEQIRAYQPEDERARSGLIDLNFRLGQGSQALSELDHYISFLWSGGQKDQAILFVQNLVSEMPEQAGIRRRLAELYRLTGRVDEAVAQLDETGDILAKLGDRSGAIEAVKAIVALEPHNIDDYKRLLEELRGQD
jgi:tetratricopeptide (TPR) repeat protein